MIKRIEGKWIYFDLLDTPDRKTQSWQIMSKYGDFLGDIKWFNRWRTYAYFPEDGTIYEDDCLGEITQFIKRLIDERKKK